MLKSRTRAEFRKLSRRKLNLHLLSLMASPRKKKLRMSEFDDLASLEEETVAKVHGMITGKIKFKKAVF